MKDKLIDGIVIVGNLSRIEVAVGAKNFPLLGGARGGFPYNFVSNATNHTVYPEDPLLILTFKSRAINGFRGEQHLDHTSLNTIHPYN
jgi:hypothetical protein